MFVKTIITTNAHINIYTEKERRGRRTRKLYNKVLIVADDIISAFYFFFVYICAFLSFLNFLG